MRWLGGQKGQSMGQREAQNSQARPDTYSISRLEHYPRDRTPKGPRMRGHGPRFEPSRPRMRGHGPRFEPSRHSRPPSRRPVPPFMQHIARVDQAPAPCQTCLGRLCATLGFACRCRARPHASARSPMACVGAWRASALHCRNPDLGLIRPWRIRSRFGPRVDQAASQRLLSSLSRDYFRSAYCYAG